MGSLLVFSCCISFFFMVLPIEAVILNHFLISLNFETNSKYSRMCVLKKFQITKNANQIHITLEIY